MESALPQHYVTAEEYLARERAADYKSEYFHGEVFAMAGGTRRHNAIGLSTGAAIKAVLKGRGCNVYNSDMRIEIAALNKYTYPNVAVACSGEQIADRDDVLTNPILIVEVLSPTTESYDRGKKFEHYAAIESLREYILVSQDEPKIESFYRAGLDEPGWSYTMARGLDGKLLLRSVDSMILLSDVYDQVSFEVE